MGSPPDRSGRWQRPSAQSLRSAQARSPRPRHGWAGMESRPGGPDCCVRPTRTEPPPRRAAAPPEEAGQCDRPGLQRRWPGPFAALWRRHWNRRDRRGCGRIGEGTPIRSVVGRETQQPLDHGLHALAQGRGEHLPKLLQKPKPAAGFGEGRGPAQLTQEGGRKQQVAQGRQQDLPQPHPKRVVGHQGEGRLEVGAMAGWIAGGVAGSQRLPRADRRAGHSPKENISS